MSDIDRDRRYKLDAEGVVRELARIGCIGNVTSTGSESYDRCFIVDSEGFSVGRITIFEGVYHHTKWYFKEYGDLVGTDRLITQWEYLLTTNKTLNDWDYDSLVYLAKQAQQEDYDAKKQWRVDNPPKLKSNGKKGRRRALQYKNLRMFIKQLMYVHFEEKT